MLFTQLIKCAILNLMNKDIYNKIRDVLKSSSGLSQKGLAEAMGVNPAAVNRMLHGARNIKINEVPIIEDYLGIKLDLYSEDSIKGKKALGSIAKVMRGEQEGVEASFGQSSKEGKKTIYARRTDKVPVYDAENKTVDWVLRHPAQFGVEDAFAVYISSDDMQPRYFYGETVYIHTGRLPEMGKDCLVETHDGTRFIKRFLRQDANKIYFSQFNPERVIEISKSAIKNIYAVVGRG